ncbi:MAG TPA: hypothetical protein VHL59_06910 [Thermoanaerobaculia bacterium]|nr:hypothetical protein [Thermoanaerobaculia bacterium]
MKCEDYLQDPEANAAHLESCAACRAMALELDDAVEIEPRPLNVDALPLAPWEGASHRTWPLVAAGVVAVLILAAVLFLAAGISPLRGIARAVVSAVPSLDLMLNLSQLAGGALHNAPVMWHVAIGVSFLVINTLLFLLLRRAPKGIDV